MTKLIHDMGADCIEDLIATVSLYRPGPMDNIPMFIRCKKGEEKVQYIYPALENILANTYGIIVYQEQILRIVQEIAGYSLAEADLLRRAIGKKIAHEMAQHKEDFIKRAHQIQGGDINKAVELFKLIETFANYGFNKAHAAAYAIVGYKGAYLKAYYPLYFVCVSMTAELHNTEKLVELILEAKKLEISVIPPDINKSGIRFSIENDKILYSLAAIKNIGEHLVSQIIEARPFADLDEVLDKINLNKREIECLIKSGALDSFGMNRGVLWQTYLITNLSRDSFLFAPDVFIDESHQWSEDDCLQYEYEVLGIYLSGHPLNRYQPKNFGFKNVSEFDIQHDCEGVPNAAILQSYAQKFGKKNNKYYICTFSDLNGMWTGMLVDENLFDILPALKNKPIYCSARIRNGRIIVNNLCGLSDKLKSTTDLHVRVKDKEQFRTIFEPLKTQYGLGVYMHDGDISFLGYIDNIEQILPQLSEYSWFAKFN
jgi:DNA polymerase-3 subunit alpha